MARAATVLVVLLGAALYATTTGTRQAAACSGPPGHEVMLSAKVILEGRVALVGPAESSDSVYTTHAMTFDVVRGYRGVADGARVTATARIPVPGVPIMCPQFPQDIEGKYVITGLFEDEADGPLRAEAWVLLYASDDAPTAADPAYTGAVRLAELVADANPEAPLLTVDPTVVTCGEPVSFVGDRFPAGEYAIRESFGPILAVLEVGASGTFATATPYGPGYGCGTAPGTSAIVSYSAFRVMRHPDGSAELGELVEIVGPALDPDVRPPARERAFAVSPERARCGQDLTIEGTGFVPVVPLLVRLSGETSGATLTPDATGAFRLTRTIPPESCTGGFIRVVVSTAEFAEFGHFAELADALIARVATPGPPDVGDSPGAARPADHAWAVLVGGFVLALSASLGVLAMRR